METLGHGFQDFVLSVSSLEVNAVNSTVRLIVSMALGVLVGAERKRKGQVAGVRTFALISMGACLAMILSIYVPQEYMGLKNGDPGRIAAQVITGVGFLGGGAMIHLKGAVRGLTTAAGIWMTSIIGMAIGVGMYTCGILATVLSLVVLMTFDRYEQFRHVGQEARTVSMTVQGIVRDIEPFRAEFERHQVHVSNFFIEYNYDLRTTDLKFVVLTHSSNDLLPLFQSLERLGKLDRVRLSS